MGGPKQNRLKVSVIGDGGWGTAVALVMAGRGHDVTLWGAFPEYVEEMLQTRENKRFLPGFPLPESLELTSSVEKALDAEMLVNAVPTQFVRAVFEKFKPSYSGDKPVASLSKGIENKTMLRPTEVLREILGHVPVATVSGPSHAEEVARGLPTTVVAASEDEELAVKVQETLTTETFRVYTSPDIVGTELAGALKNVIAIAAGIAEGLGFGDNAKAALLSRGIVEMSRVGSALGGRRETFFGLAGVGDLYTTCASRFGRNRAVGERIGKGEKVAEILGSMKMVAEGVATAKSVNELSLRVDVEMPIAEQVYEVLYKDKDPMQGVIDLMTRPLKPEFW